MDISFIAIATSLKPPSTNTSLHKKNTMKLHENLKVYSHIMTTVMREKIVKGVILLNKMSNIYLTSSIHLKKIYRVLQDCWFISPEIFYFLIRFFFKWSSRGVGDPYAPPLVYVPEKHTYLANKKHRLWIFPVVGSVMSF